MLSHQTFWTLYALEILPHLLDCFIYDMKLSSAHTAFHLHVHWLSAASSKALYACEKAMCKKSFKNIIKKYVLKKPKKHVIMQNCFRYIYFFDMFESIKSGNSIPAEAYRCIQKSKYEGTLLHYSRLVSQSLPWDKNYLGDIIYMAEKPETGAAVLHSAL